MANQIQPQFSLPPIHGSSLPNTNKNFQDERMIESAGQKVLDAQKSPREKEIRDMGERIFNKLQ